MSGTRSEPRDGHPGARPDAGTTPATTEVAEGASDAPHGHGPDRDAGHGAAVVGVPFLGFLLAPLFRKAPESWVPIGLVNQYKVGETVQVAYSDPSPLAWAGLAAQTSLWLRRDGEADFTAFAVNCTHLGCPVRWFAQSRLFMCPCHGGVYYEDGSRASGPPPRGLFEYDYQIREGQLWVRGGQLPTLAGPV